MVSRFLGWKLPKDFGPDCFVSFNRDAAERYSWPVGTNLLTADQARAMLQYVLGEPAPDERPKQPVTEPTTGVAPKNKQPTHQSSNPVARVTPDMVTSAILSVAHHILPDTQITVCVLTLTNGTKLLGYNYGSIDPAAQDWEQGLQAAYNMAREKIWELEGYALRERLAQGGAA